MTTFRKRCELEALVTERAKMETHDKECVAGLEGTCYADADYDDLAARIRALAEEEKTPVPDDELRLCCDCVHADTHVGKPPCSDCFNRPGAPRWTPRERPEDPGGCEEADELRKQLSETEDARDAATESLVDVARQRDEARKQYDEIRATLHSISEELTKANVPACDTYARAVRCLAHERDACSRMAERADEERVAARADVERLKQELRDMSGRLQASDSIIHNLTDSRCLWQQRAEKAEQELVAAREQLPAWAKPFAQKGYAEARLCPEPDCAAFTCKAFRALTPDQRRQCEEP
jgi:hypothetical protein